MEGSDLMNDKEKEKSIVLSKEEMKALEKKMERAYFGRQVLHLSAIVLGGLAMTEFFYATGHQLMFYAAIVASLDFLRADIMAIIRETKYLREKKDEDKEENNIKLVK